MEKVNKMKEFPLIKIKGSTPHERGMQYGMQAKEMIIACIESYKMHFQKIAGVTWEEIKEKSILYSKLAESEMPDILEEAKGVALGAGVDFSDIMALNCRYEVLNHPLKGDNAEGNECTAYAILAEAMEDGRMIFGQNWDYRPFTLNNTLLLHIEEEDGTRIMGLAEAGSLMRNGFNTRGVGLCANSLRSKYDSYEIGLPTTFLRRRILKSHSFEEAEKLVMNWNRSVSNNILIVAKSGLAIDFEVTPKNAYKILPDKGIVTHANHFLVDRTVEASKSSKFRGERLEELLKKKHGKITIDYVKECLQDHQGWPNSICSHIPPDCDDINMQWQTNASMIYDFTDNKLHLCYGPPCEGTYLSYQL